jgi:hypothetical protein
MTETLPLRLLRVKAIWPRSVFGAVFGMAETPCVDNEGIVSFLDPHIKLFAQTTS